MDDMSLLALLLLSVAVTYYLSGGAECLVALVDVDAASRDLPRVVGPALLADAEGLVPLDLAAGVLSAVHLDAGVPAGRMVNILTG